MITASSTNDRSHADSPMPDGNAPPATPPLLDELTDEEFAKLALAASLTKDVGFVQLAAMLDSDQLSNLLQAYNGSRLSVPKPDLFHFLRDAVDAAVAVANGDLTLAQAVRTHHTPKRLIKEAVALVQSHTVALNELSRKISHREAKRRYRAKRRREGFSSRGRPLKSKS